MIEPHASMLPLQTIADYLWNSSAYEPSQSETHAVVSQYGEDAPRQLAPFLKTYGTYYWDDGNFTALFKERRTPLQISKMQAELDEMDSALERLHYQRRLEPLLNEISPALKQTSERMAEVKADPAFLHLADDTLQWNPDYETLSAYYLTQSPNLDGSFAKWESGPIYRLDESEQVHSGAKLWKGPHDLSAAWHWRGTQAISMWAWMWLTRNCINRSSRAALRTATRLPSPWRRASARTFSRRNPPEMNTSSISARGFRQRETQHLFR